MDINDIKKPFANDGDTSDFPYEIDPNGFLSWIQGYGIDYQKTPEEGNKYIERLPFNKILNLITAYMIDLKEKMATQTDLSNKLDKSEYYADKPNFVTLNTAQTITSTKIYNATPQAINNPVNPNDLVRLAYLTSVGGVGLGFQQSYQNLTNQRATNITYTNATNRPILVVISYEIGPSELSVYVNDVKITYDADPYGVDSIQHISFIVPSNQTYIVSTSSSYRLLNWVELR
ncbi:hypothetical protein I9086_00165 [Campylobacter jejuni]|nr:hypothetical protein [Campylobacter jejuni]